MATPTAGITYLLNNFFFNVRSSLPQIVKHRGKKVNILPCYYSVLEKNKKSHGEQAVPVPYRFTFLRY